MARFDGWTHLFLRRIKSNAAGQQALHRLHFDSAAGQPDIRLDPRDIPETGVGPHQMGILLIHVDVDHHLAAIPSQRHLGDTAHHHLAKQ